MMADRQLLAVDPQHVPWNAPTLVVRSGSMDRMAAFFQAYTRRAASPKLHILSHARDEPTIRALAPCDFVFHPYSSGSRYRVNGLSVGEVERLRDLEFGFSVFLDNTVSGDRLGEVEDLVIEVSSGLICRFCPDNRFYRSNHWQLHAAATVALAQFVDWLQVHLEAGSTSAGEHSEPDALSTGDVNP